MVQLERVNMRMKCNTADSFVRGYLEPGSVDGGFTGNEICQYVLGG